MDKLPSSHAIQGHTAAFACNQSTSEELAPRLPESKVIKLEKQALPWTGAGRFLALNQGISVKTAVDKLKAHLGLKFLRVALAVNANEASEIKAI